MTRMRTTVATQESGHGGPKLRRCMWLVHKKLGGKVLSHDGIKEGRESNGTGLNGRHRIVNPNQPLPSFVGQVLIIGRGEGNTVMSSAV
ncbi:uncharacterized protein J3R85_015748 [Psidium guajava]|nr:uncharacterized protein J3R85_015748 [Psidium guajava]